MTENDTQLIIDRIDQVRADLKDDLMDVRADVRAVEDQVRQTNGRVQALERWRAKIEGAQWAVGWVPPAITAIAAAAAGAVVTYFLT